MDMHVVLDLSVGDEFRADRYFWLKNEGIFESCYSNVFYNFEMFTCLLLLQFLYMILNLST